MLFYSFVPNAEFLAMHDDGRFDTFLGVFIFIEFLDHKITIVVEDRSTFLYLGFRRLDDFYLEVCEVVVKLLVGDVPVRSTISSVNRDEGTLSFFGENRSA